MDRLFIQTPLLHSRELGGILGADVFIKMEALQPSGSFKNRGIGRLCSHFASSGVPGLVSSSGGNAGLAVTYSGKILSLSVLVVMPKTSGLMMRKRIEAEGAEVIVEGEQWDQADQLARKIASERNWGYVPPFDHPLIWEGNATMIHEVHQEGVVPDAVVLSVGGGGLLCGVVQGLHEVGWNSVPVVTSETEGAASFAKSIKAGTQIHLDKMDSIATSLCAPYVAQQALEWSKRHTIIPETVTDRQAVAACLAFADDYRVLVEPACGAALALVYEKREILQRFKKILVIVCGGGGVNRSLLRKWAKQMELVADEN